MSTKAVVKFDSPSARQAVFTTGLMSCALILTGCGTLPGHRTTTDVFGTQPPLPQVNRGPIQVPDGATQTTPLNDADGPVKDKRSEADFYDPGDGVFTRAPRSRPLVTDEGGEVTLNFENTSLLEVVKVVLGDLLGENYVVDPAVQGTVTLQTSDPLPRGTLLPTLEMLLRMNGAALVNEGGLYNVVPRESALRGRVSPQLGNSSVPLPKGFSLRIVPLRFISALEMQSILEPFAETGNIVRVDSQRNLLVLAGTGQELSGMLDVVDIFDVDWMKGQSVALFTPDFVGAETLSQELEKILGAEGDGPLAGLVRFVVLERLDALLVVSSSTQYLSRVDSWVRRLDKDTGAVGQRLYVYQVQNGKAAELADVLTQVFTDTGERAAPPPEVAPGEEGVSLASAAPELDEPLAEGEEPPPPPPVRPSATPQTVAATAGSGLSVTQSDKIKVIADEVNNSLLILANTQQYRQIEGALRELDVAPLQVLIEATIAEVTLENRLAQGVQWFFKNNGVDFNGGDSRGTASLNATLDPQAIGNGSGALTYAISGAFDLVTNRAVPQFVLQLLASESEVNVISSPSLMVLNNQEAQMNVGDEVPVITERQESTDADSTVLQNVDRVDTGVLLTVTPRVNAGGLVTMEIAQSVNNVSELAADSGLGPTITKREISSTVAVQSGETVILGGLIREDDEARSSGVPGLHKIPVLGGLFGSDSQTLNRTELVIMITPRAIRGAFQARDITEEYRQKMESLRGVGRLDERPAPQAAPAQEQQYNLPPTQPTAPQQPVPNQPIPQNQQPVPAPQPTPSPYGRPETVDSPVSPQTPNIERPNRPGQTYSLRNSQGYQQATAWQVQPMLAGLAAHRPAMQIPPPLPFSAPPIAAPQTAFMQPRVAPRPMALDPSQGPISAAAVPRYAPSIAQRLVAAPAQPRTPVTTKPLVTAIADSEADFETHALKSGASHFATDRAQNFVRPTLAAMRAPLPVKPAFAAAVEPAPLAQSPRDAITRMPVVTQPADVKVATPALSDATSVAINEPASLPFVPARASIPAMSDVATKTQTPVILPSPRLSPPNDAPVFTPTGPAEQPIASDERQEQATLDTRIAGKNALEDLASLTQPTFTDPKIVESIDSPGGEDVLFAGMRLDTEVHNWAVHSRVGGNAHADARPIHRADGKAETAAATVNRILGELRPPPATRINDWAFTRRGARRDG